MDPALASPLFSDIFPNGTIDPTKWEMSFAAIDQGCGFGLTAPNSLRLDAGEDILSKPIALGGSAAGWVSFWLKRGDDQGTPNCSDAAGDHEITIDYLNATSTWTCLLLYQHGSAGSCAQGSTQSETIGWWARTLRLPADALWSGFRLRFTACCGIPGMDWAIDDVYVWNGSLPSAPGPMAPMDDQRGGDYLPQSRRPRFEFSSVDPDSNPLRYRIQVDDDPWFHSPVVDATSGTDPGFADLTGGGSDPFPSGDRIRCTPDSDLADSTFTFRTAGQTPPGGPAGPEIRTLEAIIILLSILIPLVVLLFLFTRRKKKVEEPVKEEREPDKPGKAEPVARPGELGEKSAAKEGEPPHGKPEPEPEKKPKKDPKEINPWDKLEE
ncbi:MAG TPA: hypothetical protein VI893_08880 [Thermoplasmata archaeon]|nr:hypothetical protein [Thermoplasmata archaeon]